MTEVIQTRMADWTTRVEESEIRRLLRFRPKYYFAGGMPGNQPLAIMRGIIHDIAQNIEDISIGKDDIFNYGPTEGIKPLREILSNRMYSREGVRSTADNVVISTGSQQGLYGLMKVMMNPGDVILISRPSYLGFIGVTNVLDVKVISLPADDQGILPEAISSACELSLLKYGKRPKVIYVQTFSENPTGKTLGETRKQAIYDAALDQNLLILEDAAYKEIQFSSGNRKPIKYFDTENEHVAYLGTTSKEAAVFRIGYSVLPEMIRKEYIKLKGFLDLCTPGITQTIATEYYEKHIDSIIPEIVNGYKKQADAIGKALDTYLPGERTHPTGGFFVWKKINGVNTTKLLDKALENGVLYVPGAVFYAARGVRLTEDLSRFEKEIPRHDEMRLSFSLLDPETIDKGIEVLSKLVK